ncbi:hypothetical protein MKX01_028279 [Papaver californicum]|nr:hypothetical protein MKX01_038281 [Papaver californicum]KAI3992821.1 hypothetical protein MKX01_028279 [Papaver californicum]
MRFLTPKSSLTLFSQTKSWNKLLLQSIITISITIFFSLYISPEIISRFQQYLQIYTAHPNPKYYESNQNLRSILLNSHTDVLPAEHHKWTHSPFDANVDEFGDIYARVSRSDSGSGFQPIRTVYLSFVPDEEIGGHEGAEKFAESEKFKKMNVGIVLDEGLPSTDENYRIFYAEKCAWWLTIKLYDNSAMENLLKSIESARRFRVSQFDLVKAGLMAEGEVISVNMVFLKAGTPTPTGFVMNLQPSEAEAGFDVRVPPTADPISLEKRISEEWAPSSRNMTFEFKQQGYNFEKKFVTATYNSNPWWKLLEGAVEKANGKLGKPEIFPASTDARYFRKQGLPAIGFSPMINTPILLHDHNEFLNQAEYLKGIAVYESIVKEYTSYIELTSGEASRDEL